MAIIRCPQCNQRISSHAPACSHCGAVLADLSPEERKRLRGQRWQRHLRPATRLSYLGLVLFLAGSLWWWFHDGVGWALPPPLGSALLLFLGCVVYLIARGWLFWVRLNLRKQGP